MGKKHKGEINMAVLEEFRDTLTETKKQDLYYSVKELRGLGEEITQEHPEAFSDEDIDKIIKQARLYAKAL
ncbi:hypothetical protein ACFWDG_06050 [Peribacillus sp. NPDC060186]